jgi:hypothetical protein
MLFLAGVVQFFLFGGFATKKEKVVHLTLSTTYVEKKTTIKSGTGPRFVIT